MIMATPPPRPDLIIGIDFGMTYTGVAWTNLANPTQVEKKWPGQVDSGESKVPTKLLYSRSGSVLSWGFTCDEDGMPGQKPIQWFKIYLDHDSLERARSHGLDTPRSTNEAKQWITDYLHQVYLHLEYSMQRDGQGWSEKKIEFIFSVPTTWTNQAIVTDYKSAIQNAGFGSISLHTVQVGLTEAEAAAVYTVKGKQIPGFTNGDNMLVCDAGGGTTDLALFQVTDPTDPPVLKQLAAVQGIGIGSTVIDRKFRELVRQRVANYPDVAAQLPDGLATTLANGQKFRSIKHKFGSAAGDHDQYYLTLEGVQWSFNHAGMGIEGGKMRFSRADIKGLFDPVIEGMIRKIDEQLNWMKKLGDSEQVGYLILSGGLGSSEYVRSRLEERYVHDRHPMARQLAIVTSGEPQLAVARGLVEDRRQKLSFVDRAVITSRVARASYGIICMSKYDPAKHFNEEIKLDEFNKKQKWVVNQIDWLIRKGDDFDTDSTKERPFLRTLAPNESNRKWKSTVVISHASPEFLPSSMRQGGATQLCTIESNLSGLQQKDFIEKGKYCWSGKKHHFRVNYDIKVVIGSADLRFELWFKGQRYGQNEDPVSVEWDVGATLKPKDEAVRDIAELEGY